jgi:antitoxin CptB
MSEIENYRKRLIFRSWHRGTREMDLIMGSFADKYLPDYDLNKLQQYEAILEVNDPDLYSWFSKQQEAPANLMTDVMEQLMAHNVSACLT